MKRWLTLLLLIGAIVGLLGQETAFARVVAPDKTEPRMAAPQADASRMSPECAEMMGLANQSPQPGKPCQGMTPDCIAKMGCTVAATLIPPLASTISIETRRSRPLQMPVAPLVGRETIPEPHPPAILG